MFLDFLVGAVLDLHLNCGFNAQRDKDFLQRLQKYRYSGVNKYEDDYYGDKVMTLSDYRQWVRQQQKRREVMEAQNLDTEAAKKS